MTTIKEQLIRLAERVGEAYMAIPEVRAFVIFGSTADGTVDEHSDLDTLAFCEQVPERAMRQQAAERLGGKCSCQTLWDGSPWDVVRLENVEECCVILRAIADVESRAIRQREKIVRFCRRLNPFEERANGVPDPDSDELLLQAANGVFWPSEAQLADLHSCLVVHDPDGIVARWKAELSDFPAEAREVAIEHRLFFSTRWVVEDMSRAIAVGDDTHFALKRAAAIEHFVRLLYTLNHRYFRKPKWFAQHLAGFPHQPPDALSRLSKAWSGSGPEVVEELRVFANDLTACVREGCPEADVERVVRCYFAD